MRVISGKYRGKKLFATDDVTIRPTLDRVKETLFNIIQFDVRSAKVLDLFAGSGALGIECISRGASEVVFVDNDTKSLSVLKKNLDLLKDEPYIVYENDYLYALKMLQGKKFDIIFVDPPYDKGLYVSALTKISELKLLSENGKIICEHKKELTLPDEIQRLVKQREKDIGSVSLCFYTGETSFVI